jgi:hypothetical protein
MKEGGEKVRMKMNERGYGDGNEEGGGKFKGFKLSIQVGMGKDSRGGGLIWVVMDREETIESSLI